MTHSMPCRNPCRLNIHLAFTYSVGPSSVVWSKLGPAPPIPTNKSAWSVMVTGSQSRVWCGPNIPTVNLEAIFAKGLGCGFKSSCEVQLFLMSFNWKCMWQLHPWTSISGAFLYSHSNSQQMIKTLTYWYSKKGQIHPQMRLHFPAKL